MGLEDGLKLIDKKPEIRDHPHRKAAFKFFQETFSVETWIKIQSTLKTIHYHGPPKRAQQIIDTNTLQAPAELKDVLAGLAFLANLEAAIGFENMVKWNAMRNLGAFLDTARIVMNLEMQSKSGPWYNFITEERKKLTEPTQKSNKSGKDLL